MMKSEIRSPKPEGSSKTEGRMDRSLAERLAPPSAPLVAQICNLPYRHKCPVI